LGTEPKEETLMGALRIVGVLLIVVAVILLVVGIADYYSFGLFGFITGTAVTATDLLVGGVVAFLFGLLAAVFG
jgi:hypothetical protein